MAVKKSAAKKAAEVVEVEITETKSQAEETPAVEATSVEEPERFCVYIGPSIRGVIQSGTIYGKSLKDTKAFLATAIEMYPLIGKLISTDKTIAEDRIKVKTAGNLLNVYYTKLASGKSN